MRIRWRAQFSRHCQYTPPSPQAQPSNRWSCEVSFLVSVLLDAFDTWSMTHEGVENICPTIDSCQCELQGGLAMCWSADQPFPWNWTWNSWRIKSCTNSQVAVLSWSFAVPLVISDFECPWLPIYFPSCNGAICTNSDFNYVYRSDHHLSLSISTAILKTT